MISKKALQWSADANITSKELRLSPEREHLCEEFLEIEQWCLSHAVQGIDIAHDMYHQKISRFSFPPSVMYRKGDISLLDRSLLAIVGPRKPSVFLTQVTKEICSLLGSYRIATVSGGAEGIDMLVHQESIVYGIPTIVVLGGGFRRYEKRREWELFEQVVEAGGLILSERKLDQQPAVYTFPQRNRIIAGISDVVFLPGAARGSGSLITVDFALQFGIPVVTVPGSYYEPTCAGSNDYLCSKKIQGSTNLHKLLEQFFGHTLLLQQGQSQNSWRELTSEEQQVITLLKEPLILTALVKRLGRELPVVLEVLLHLEMKQLIFCPEPGWYVCRNN